MGKYELTYNYFSNEHRFGIYDVANKCWYIDGLHCGTCFDVFYNGEWVPTRIEYSSDWCLVDLPLSGLGMNGLPVRL